MHNNHISVLQSDLQDIGVRAPGVWLFLSAFDATLCLWSEHHCCATPERECGDGWTKLLFTVVMVL